MEFTGSFTATGLEDRAGGSSRFGMIYGWQKQGGLKFEKQRSLAARISLQKSPICDHTSLRFLLAVTHHQRRQEQKAGHVFLTLLGFLKLLKLFFFENFNPLPKF